MACCVGFSDDWVDFSIVWPMKEWKFGLIRVHWVYHYQSHHIRALLFLKTVPSMFVLVVSTVLFSWRFLLSRINQSLDTNV
jgi:hypothetical protein